MSQKRKPRSPLPVCLQALSPQKIFCQPSHVSFTCNVQGFSLPLAGGGGHGAWSSCSRTGITHLIPSKWKGARSDYFQTLAQAVLKPMNEPPCTPLLWSLLIYYLVKVAPSSIHLKISYYGKKLDLKRMHAATEEDMPPRIQPAL